MKTITLNTLKTLLVFFLLSVFMIPAYAEYENKNSTESDCQHYLNEDIDPIVIESEKNPIKILGLDESLVAEGSADNQIIQNYMRVSDFLTEVNNTKYYRISYQESLTLNQKMAIQ